MAIGWMLARCQAVPNWVQRLVSRDTFFLSRDVIEFAFVILHVYESIRAYANDLFFRYSCSLWKIK
jgi:hypothetical protein